MRFVALPFLPGPASIRGFIRVSGDLYRPLFELCFMNVRNTRSDSDQPQTG